MIQLLVLYALFATTFIFGEQATALVPPIFFVALRMIGAGIVLLSYTTFIKKQSLRIPKKDWLWFLGIIIFHIYFSYVLEFIAYPYLSGSYVALIYNLSPFVTALFAYFFLHERMTRMQWAGIGIGFLSALPIAITKTAASKAVSVAWHLTFLAQGAVVISMIATCIGWIFLKKMTTERSYSYVFVNGIGMLLGGVLALGTSYGVEQWPSYTFIVTNGYFLTLLGLSILIGNIIVYNLYGKLLQSYSATALSFFQCSTPIFAAGIDWAWLGVRVGPLFLITAAATSLGLYMFYRDELQGVTHPIDKTVAEQSHTDGR